MVLSGAYHAFRRVFNKGVDMRRMKWVSVWIGTVAIASVAAGCSGQAERTGSEAVRDGRSVANQTGDAVKDAGSAVGDAVLNGGRAADAAVETLDVKTALMADSRIDAGDINVDTDHVTKTVTLKGHVPNAAQRTFAEEVAVKKAIGYRVENELTITS
jgi:osmotically-inducible protein OsmY